MDVMEETGPGCPFIGRGYGCVARESFFGTAWGKSEFHVFPEVVLQYAE